MTTIHQDHVIDSVADALQFISYYHPKDFVDAVHDAYQREESKPAKDAMAHHLFVQIRTLCVKHIRGINPADMGGGAFAF